jgi:hypothetical protein
MPCKQAAVDVADVVEPLPGLLHAANTLVRTEAGWRAENTDVLGVGTALQQAGVTSVAHAAIVGAGGERPLQRAGGVGVLRLELDVAPRLRHPRAGYSVPAP